ncbi:unnamed protein product [Rotaria magnacalcarata]|uniref:Ephrin RBD domain-containing protein n=2 Tax=Rotaria magnacalcarata TaxID=392030 RepID=A0A816R2I0_9BILA|nr:unnamed protein product [Rotaria magnacalcarata]CAF1959413.1 unnamed protein product [Rotaria magnacalcarata]CAF2068710.1 unnamed protein product [Rotaria magnacalcarata]CAF2133122.1 unnamed protein product [Rotaria magnacalcarata]CAF3748686.1 unnamed protein product [Rotaria magnacalcarata]
MMLYLIFIYLLSSLISVSYCQYRRRQNFQVEWNSSNPFFSSNNTFILNARLGDTIDFFCPYYNESTSTEYNTLYLVSKIDYHLCLTENYQPLLVCDQSHSLKRLMYTLSISKYLPYPTIPEFQDGNSYYFISTSNGEKNGIYQKYDGLCRTKNLRFIIDVQKYYRRYSINQNNQYRIKLQKQLLNETNEQYQQLTSSNSRRISVAYIFPLLYSILYLYSFFL